MASLNLVPDPQVLVVQAGIFLANIAIIKKLIVEPYTAMRDQRSALTVGNREEAERALQEAEAASQRVTSRLGEAAKLAKEDREQTRLEATEKRQAILSKAEAESKSLVDKVEADIRAELKAERAKVPAIIAQLTDEAYRIAVN